MPKEYLPRSNMDTRWIVLALIVVVAETGKAGEYKLDLANPVRITESPGRISLPTRVDIYVTGPRIYINKAETPWSLAKHPSVLSLTNQTEIDKLISVLRVSDNKQRITNVTHRVGYTYHLLLFQDADHTVMHFRVFETTEFQTPWCMVYPRDDIGFVYFNNKIGSWLHSHVNAPTNAIPPTNQSQTNKPVSSAELTDQTKMTNLLAECQKLARDGASESKDTWTVNDSLPPTIKSLSPQYVQLSVTESPPATVVDIQTSGGFEHRGYLVVCACKDPNFVPKKGPNWTITKVAPGVFEYRE